MIESADATEPEPAPGPLDAGQLVRQCQAGSREAFALLVGQYQERIYNFLLKLTRQPHDAEDLAQETFFKVWKHIGRFDGRSSFSTWLFTVAKRTAFNHLRSRRPVFDDSGVPEEADLADPASLLVQQEEGRQLWGLARTLPPKQYQVLWLRYGEGFSVGEIAQIMGIYSIHARVLLHRGRNQLAKLLKPDSQPITRTAPNRNT